MYLLQDLGGEVFFFFQAEDGIRDIGVTEVQTCALPISNSKDGVPKKGLRDALLHRDCTSKYSCSKTSLRTRYQLGLEDGQTLLRMAVVVALWRSAI